MDGFLGSPIQFRQLFLHLTLQIPIRALRCNIKHVLTPVVSFTGEGNGHGTY